jgi:hypothetical protein
VLKAGGAVDFGFDSGPGLVHRSSAKITAGKMIAVSLANKAAKYAQVEATSHPGDG